MAKRAKVIKSDPPESTEILAEAIVRIGKAFDELSRGGLNEKGIIALIHDDCKVSKKQIKIVLDSMRQLSARYCRHPPQLQKICTKQN